MRGSKQTLSPDSGVTCLAGRRERKRIRLEYGVVGAELNAVVMKHEVLETVTDDLEKGYCFQQFRKN